MTRLHLWQVVGFPIIVFATGVATEVELVGLFCGMVLFCFGLYLYIDQEINKRDKD